MDVREWMYGDCLTCDAPPGEPCDPNCEIDPQNCDCPVHGEDDVPSTSPEYRESLQEMTREAVHADEPEGDEEDPEITFWATECNDDPITAPLSEVQEHQSWPVCSACNSFTCREPVGEVPGLTEPTDEPVSGEGEAIVDAALNHCAECLSFRPDTYDAGDDLDRVLTRVRHLREKYGDEEAGSGGWATRYQQDVCALLNLLHDRATHADARSGEVGTAEDARIASAVMSRVDENGYVTYELTRSGEEVGVCPACTSAAGAQHNADKMHFAECPIAARLGLSDAPSGEGERGG